MLHYLAVVAKSGKAQRRSSKTASAADEPTIAERMVASNPVRTCLYRQRLGRFRRSERLSPACLAATAPRSPRQCQDTAKQQFVAIRQVHAARFLRRRKARDRRRPDRQHSSREVARRFPGSPRVLHLGENVTCDPPTRVLRSHRGNVIFTSSTRSVPEPRSRSRRKISRVVLRALQALAAVKGSDPLLGAGGAATLGGLSGEKKHAAFWPARASERGHARERMRIWRASHQEAIV